MKLGAFDICPVTDGRFRLDGGAMFGVMPRVLWEQCCRPDGRNRIPLSLTCLLIRPHGKHILVDTGLGGKEDATFRERYAVDRSPSLPESLKQLGLSVDDIDLVINTHLHFDHAGGNTMAENGHLRPVFRKARYAVQRGEYEDALSPNERTRAGKLRGRESFPSVEFSEPETPRFGTAERSTARLLMADRGWNPESSCGTEVMFPKKCAGCRRGGMQSNRWIVFRR